MGSYRMDSYRMGSYRMGKRWRIRSHDTELIERLERLARIPAVVAQLLVGRGVHDARQARAFIDAKFTDLRQPDQLPGVDEATDRILAAVRQRRRIVIYGDYDADGMTGTGILYRCLKLLGGDVGYYVPNRLDDGYGVHDQALRSLASRGTSMVITVDCGIASVREAETATELGLELIVTDHHQFGDRLPRAAAIVHPRLPGHAYPFGGLCGAGVALKLAWGLCQRACGSTRVSQPMREFLLSAVGVAAIGTVADVVPLVDENRVIVRHGLAGLVQRPVPGIRELMRVTELDRKPTLSSEDIAFTLAPRLNAAGRLGQAQLGVELLTTESSERAAALAAYIHELNGNRDSLERSIYLAATKQAKERFDVDRDPALVLAGHGWHAGVIGIVAGRLAEKYHRPVVLISLDELGAKPGIGSARTACGLDLYEAFNACSSRLVTHGGHAAAAGLKIEEKDVDGFRDEFLEHVAGEISQDDRVAELRIDAETPLSQLTLTTVQQIEQMSPFGMGNPRPVLCACGVSLDQPPKRIGQGERHLSLRVRQHGTALRGVAFGQGEWAGEMERAERPLDIAFQPVINEFRGRRSVEMHLLDWRLTGS